MAKSRDFLISNHFELIFVISTAGVATPSSSQNAGSSPASTLQCPGADLRCPDPKPRCSSFGGKTKTYLKSSTLQGGPPGLNFIKVVGFQYGCFLKIGVPQNGWFIMENPIKMDDLGGTTILGNPSYLKPGSLGTNQNKLHVWFWVNVHHLYPKISIFFAIHFLRSFF